MIEIFKGKENMLLKWKTPRCKVVLMLQLPWRWCRISISTNFEGKFKIFVTRIFLRKRHLGTFLQIKLFQRFLTNFFTFKTHHLTWSLQKSKNLLRKFKRTTFTGHLFIRLHLIRFSCTFTIIYLLSTAD